MKKDNFLICPRLAEKRFKSTKTYKKVKFEYITKYLTIKINRINYNLKKLLKKSAPAFSFMLGTGNGDVNNFFIAQ